MYMYLVIIDYWEYYWEVFIVCMYVKLVVKF